MTTRKQIIFWGALTVLIAGGIGLGAGLSIRQNQAVQVVDYGCLGKHFN